MNTWWAFYTVIWVDEWNAYTICPNGCCFRGDLVASYRPKKTGGGK